MVREVTIPDVPAAAVERVAREARADGATKLVETKNDDGTWTVVATFPD
jgi:hypothetical protein